MIQSLIDKIIAALIEAFPDVKVYQEQVKQGLTEPCFILRCLNPTNTLFVGETYHRTNLFSVQYLPESDTDANAECYAVCDTLFQALEVIGNEGDLIRGTGMNGEVFDDVLTFTVSYNLFVRVEPELDPMETLDIENFAR